MSDKIQDYIKLADAATGGPWWVNQKHYGMEIRVEQDRKTNGGYSRPISHHVNTEENAQFIAASRTLGPAMANALIEAEEALKMAWSDQYVNGIEAKRLANQAIATIQRIRNGG